MRGRRPGFTLLEVMISVAVIAILATIALPSFIKESRRGRVMAEVMPLFADIHIRMEVAMRERGGYPLVPSGEIAPHPEGPPGSARRALFPLPAEWADLKLDPNNLDEVYCSYTWSTGPAGGGTIGGDAAGFGFAAPDKDWYYVLARCDMDDDGTLSLYFASSLDARIQKLNDGE